MRRQFAAGMAFAVLALVGAAAVAQRDDNFEYLMIEDGREVPLARKVKSGEIVDLDGDTFTATTWYYGNGGFSAVLDKKGLGSNYYQIRFEVGVDGRSYNWSTGGRPGLTGSCNDEERWIRAIARRAGLKVLSLDINSCRRVYGDGSGGTMGTVSLAWDPMQPQRQAAKCTPDAYLGAWQRPGSPPRASILQLQFATSDYGGEGIAQGYNGHPEFNGKRVISTVYPAPDGNGCVYTAQCSIGISSPVSCKITIDPARNTLLVQDSFGIGTYFDGPWTRSATPVATGPKCSANDIDGNWHRSDGALVPIVGIDAGFRDGGNALMFNHPDGWPKGTHKFLRLFREGGNDSCEMSAVCINYDINRSTGQTTKRERNCTLTVDPQRQTLTESGSTLSYRRTPFGNQPNQSITQAPPEPLVSAPVPSAQELAELAIRERLNREQADFAANQLAQNAAAKAAFDKATAEREAIIASQNAEAERKQREYEAAMAKWRETVEACEKGDMTRCTP